MIIIFKKTGGFFRYFWNGRYPTLLRLPPLRFHRFHCVGGCWDRTRDCCDSGIYWANRIRFTIFYLIIYTKYIVVPSYWGLVNRNENKKLIVERYGSSWLIFRADPRRKSIGCTVWYLASGNKALGYISFPTKFRRYQCQSMASLFY
jgi:hypothetical protein